MPCAFYFVEYASSCQLATATQRKASFYLVTLLTLTIIVLVVILSWGYYWTKAKVLISLTIRHWSSRISQYATFHPHPSPIGLQYQTILPSMHSKNTVSSSLMSLSFISVIPKEAPSTKSHRTSQCSLPYHQLHYTIIQHPTHRLTGCLQARDTI